MIRSGSTGWPFLPSPCRAQTALKKPCLVKIHKVPSCCLPLELGDLRDQVSNFVAVEFGDWGNAVDIADQVFGGPEEGREPDLALAPAQPAPHRTELHL